MKSLPGAQIVGVIFAAADLRRAVRMQNPPDLFELRLDALVDRLDETKTAIGKLRRPLIMTARHPLEGGANRLSVRERRALLLQFLQDAAWVDVELRSARALAAVWEEAGTRHIRRIISFHDFSGTPSRSRLDRIAGTAQSLGADVLKIATRTDTLVHVARLIEFSVATAPHLPIAAMGLGRLGKKSRRELARSGSVLNYAHLGDGSLPGQPSLRELRQWMVGHRDD
jgi:3-dehydroquinate dehydratase I